MRGWLALVALVSGCDLVPRNCTMMGCSSGLSVVISPQEALADGAWEVELVREDGSSSICAFQLEAGQITESTCEVAFQGPQEPLQVDFFEEDSGDVEIEVRLEGEALHQEAFSPAYEVSQPNGPHCGPTCSRGSVEIVLAPPGAA